MICCDEGDKISVYTQQAKKQVGFVDLAFSQN